MSIRLQIVSVRLGMSYSLIFAVVSSVSRLTLLVWHIVFHLGQV